MPYEVSISPLTVIDIASKALDVPDIPADGLAALVSADDLQRVAERALSAYFDTRRDELRARFAGGTDSLLTCELCGALTTGAHPLAVWHYCSTCHARVYRAAMADPSDANLLTTLLGE
jgi:hypothetical protein